MELYDATRSDVPITEAWTQAANGPSGGDFIVRNETPDDITVVLCDAAGHGADAVRIVEFIRPFIEREIRYGLTDHLIRRWHTLVHHRYVDEPRFVCLTALRLHFATNVLTVVNGGNPDLLVRRAHGTRIDRFPSTGMPLGIVEPERWSPPRFVKTHLGMSEFAIAFSDGVIDCVGRRGDRFGMQRVLNTIRWQSESSSPLWALRTGLSRFSSASEEQDDLSILVLRNRGRQVA